MRGLKVLGAVGLCFIMGGLMFPLVRWILGSF